MAMDLSRPLSIVTPTLDGDVLAVLARAERSFTGRQVHRLVGRASEVGVRKVLARLVREGIVTAEPAGAARLYSLNRAHLAAPHIEALAGLREGLVARLRDAFTVWSPPPTFAAIFGSFARRESGPASDLDLFVIRPDDIDADDVRWRTQIDSLANAARNWTGNDARILEYGSGELSGPAAHDPVLRDVRGEGIELVGSSTALRPHRRSST